MNPRLQRQNLIILCAMQALTGSLTSSVRALTIEFDQNDDITAHFVLRQPSPEDEEEIREWFPTEMSVLTNDPPTSSEVLVTPVLHFDDGVPGPLPPGRVVFAFRPWGGLHVE